MLGSALVCGVVDVRGPCGVAMCACPLGCVWLLCVGCVVCRTVLMGVGGGLEGL